MILILLIVYLRVNLIFDYNHKNIIKHVSQRLAGISPNPVTNEMISHIDDYELSIILLNENFINGEVNKYKRFCGAETVFQS